MTARPIDEEYDTQMEVERNPCGAWQAIQAQAKRIRELGDENERLRAILAECMLAFDNVDAQVSDEGEFTERAWEQLRAAIKGETP